MKTQLIGITLVSAVLSGSGAGLVQTPVWPRPDAPYLVYPYKIAGMEISDVKWLHLHSGDAMAQSVTLGVWLVDLANSVNPATDFSPYTDTQVRVLVHGVPMSDWLALPVSYTLQLSNPALESLSDGFHDVSLDVRGPRRDLFRPNPIELHLTRGREFSPLVPIMNLDCEYCFYPDLPAVEKTFGPGVVYVDWRTRNFRGYPTNPTVTPWHTDPAHSDLYQELMAPHTDLFQSTPMWWEEPPGTASAGQKFVRALQPKVVDDSVANFRYLGPGWRPGVTNDTFGFYGLKNLPYKDGPRGVAWTSPYVSGMVDSTGGLVFTEKGGPLRYMKPTGEVVTVAGWRVKLDHDAVYFLKSLNQIRSVQEFRGTWTGSGLYTDADRGFHAPTDVTIDTRNENIWYVAGMDDNGIWKVTVDRATMVASDVHLLAGAADHGAGFVDGPSASARFSSPIGIAFNPVDNLLYVTDLMNDAVRVVNPETGAVSTLAGRPGQGARVGASGGPGCIATGPWVGCVSDNEHTAAPARAASAFTVAAGSSRKPEFYAPMGIRADSNGHLLVLDVGFAAIREFDPVSGAVRLFAETGRRFDASTIGFFGLAVDRWGNAGERDSVYWFQTVSGGEVDGESDRHVNELMGYVPRGGGKSVWLAGADWTPCPDGWGPRDCTDLPHYPWMVAVDPRGALYTSGMGEHGITRWRVRKPTDPIPANYIQYEEGKKWWYAGTMTIQSGGYSFAMKHGWGGHNLLGFEDAWGHANDTDDQLLAAFEIPTVFSAEPTRRAIVLNFLRLNAGGGGTVTPPAPPDPSPPSPPSPTPPTSPGALDVIVTCGGLIAIGAPVRVTADGHTMTATTNPQGVASFAVTGTGPAAVVAGPTAACGYGLLAIVRDGRGMSVTLALHPR